MKNLVYILCFLYFFAPINAAQIYKWTDSNGNVHFSDKPHPGAQEIQLPKIQTYSAPPVPANSPQAAEEELETNQNKQVNYKTLQIVKPEDQITIRNPQGSVSVVVVPTPKLGVGDKLQLILDNIPVGNPQTSGVFSLEGINRGSHTISADIIDPKGKVLIHSNEITIYMQQPRAGMGKGAP